MTRLRAIATAALFLAATPAAAQTMLAEPGAVSEVLRAKGMATELKTDSDGDPRITATFSGKKFLVYFYGCKNHRDCETVQFYTAYSNSKADLASLNTWNRTNRFGRAYLDTQGDPCIVMDVDMTGGIPRALFEDNLEYWTSVVPQFQKYVLPE